jgi:hypothetical protein
MLVSPKNILMEISRMFGQISRHYGPVKLAHKTNYTLSKLILFVENFNNTGLTL